MYTIYIQYIMCVYRYIHTIYNTYTIYMQYIYNNSTWQETLQGISVFYHMKHTRKLRHTKRHTLSHEAHTLGHKREQNDICIFIKIVI